MIGKIFGTGLSRTGTTTLCKTLQDAGYSFIHYPNKQQLFNLGNIQGANDLPVCANYKKLDRLYPGSKFVHTYRTKELWQDSVDRYMSARKSKDGNAGSFILENRIAVYGIPHFDLDIWSEAYDRYEAGIRDYFANRPDDILYIKITEGDSPRELYKFLKIKGMVPKSFQQLNRS